ncbi:MAG TPA: TolC family protein, partial [Planctomycetaceae bacterium]|nr:TolC family protein [Planctomycetaceae bacterium]
VVIARINQDVTLADFEASVRNLVLDVENQYWDLYLAYLQYDTAVNARSSAQRTWRDLKEEVDIDERNLPPEQPGDDLQKIAYQQPGQLGFNQQQGARNVKADEAQARDAYYQARAATEQALSTIYSTETQLRRLLGLPVNDGKVIRPLGDPLTGEFVPNFYTSLAESLTNRVELRKQKWNIKSLDLQLVAAQSLTRPRLDFVGSASLNGFGDDLLDEHTTDPVSGAGLNNMYGTLTRGDQTGWGVGVEMSVPIGYRSAHAQVRNIELRLAKAREVLSVQEMEISHELARAIQNLALTYQNSQTLLNRWIAAQEFVRIRSEEKKAGISNTDLLLRAISSQAQAESAYHISLIEYNKALADFQFRKGTLLEFNNIFLAEDDWDPDAYQDALRRARERSSAIEIPLLETEPAAFSTGPYNHQEVYFEERLDPADRENQAAPVDLQPVPETPPPPPAPATETPEAAQLRSERAAQQQALSQTAPLKRQKTLPLRKTPVAGSFDSQSNFASANRLTEQPAIVRHEVEPHSNNPVELLSVSLDVDPAPVAPAPAPVTPAEIPEQRFSSATAPPVVPQRPVLQPIPQMYTASSLTNTVTRVKPVPQEKLIQTRRPLVRSPQVATTTPKPPESQKVEPQPTTQPPAEQHAPVIAAAPQTSQVQSPTTPAVQQTAQVQQPTAPKPAVTESQVTEVQPIPVQKSPSPQRATEIELFE